MRDANEELSRDTRPLDPAQLSDGELLIIRSIEDRLCEAQKAELELPPKGRDHYLATTQERRPRVLLLDGGRGTGKTSLLLTLVRRWRSGDRGERDELSARYRERAAAPAIAKQDAPAPFEGHVAFPGSGDELPELEAPPDLSAIPAHVLPVEVLDFDPLPPHMPVMAGLIEAWRSLAEKCESAPPPPGPEHAEDAPTVLDRWHGLFRMATVGWSTVSAGGSLVEQVLDRELQMQDWLSFTHNWRRFVDEVIGAGERLRGSDALPKGPVFVVVIDDCDLQVTRLRELLPALRMLYHPRVFFIVAADQPHMLDMLRLDFLGQQNQLTAGPAPELASGAAVRDWSSSLAQASFDKVFQRRNRFELRWLSLRALLSFPLGASPTLGGIVGDWPGPGAGESAQQYLEDMARAAERVSGLPPIMPYRTAHQVLEVLRGDDGAAKGGVDAVAEILKAAGKDSHAAVVERRGRRVIDYRLTGDLAAVFEPEHVRDVAGLTETITNIDVVTSSRFDVRFRSDRRSPGLLMSRDAADGFNFAPALIAVSLREDGFPVEGGPRWDVRLAFAWTSVRMLDPLHPDAELDLAFRWPYREHPSPSELFKWTGDWSAFVQKLLTSEEEPPERTAYAWVYFQMKWAGRPLQEIADPLAQRYVEEDWDRLLAAAPDEWFERPLPLLARPEIGLAPSVQRKLLDESGRRKFAKPDLRNQRRRLITDAILAASEQAGSAAENPEAESRVAELVRTFDRHHQTTYGETSPWVAAVES